jgi:hypothetical protein
MEPAFPLYGNATTLNLETVLERNIVSSALHFFLIAQGEEARRTWRATAAALSLSSTTSLTLFLSLLLP